VLVEFFGFQTNALYSSAGNLTIAIIRGAWLGISVVRRAQFVCGESFAPAPKNTQAGRVAPVAQEMDSIFNRFTAMAMEVSGLAPSRPVLKLRCTLLL